MIDLYYWPTPNGWKASIALEELGLAYRVLPVHIGRGEQFQPDFLAISPNNRIPALVDHEPLGGGAPLSIFESGAMLMYLAEKTGRLMPTDPRGRYEVVQWVMWQMGGLGPMTGQAYHFRSYAPERIAYATDRYMKEVDRLYGVIERRLADRDYLAGDYSIADIAAWPWVVGHDRLGISLEAFPRVARWVEAIGKRPAVERGLAVGRELNSPSGPDEQAKKVLFGQTSKLPEG